MFILFLLFISATCHSSEVSSLIEKSRSLNLSQNKQWLKLVHYEKKLFGGYESQADGSPFFLSPDGKKNPQAELEATIQSFFESIKPEKKYDVPMEKLSPVERHKRGFEEILAQHPQCRFPARWKWLKETLNISGKSLPKPDCSKFDKFRTTLNAKSATIVFSSYYLNNPASGFGHTFIRLNKTPLNFSGSRYELLDYGISYAATVTISNPVLYAIYGIFGFFPGELSSIPYYYKVREYNDFESRDLWEYDLTLNEKQVDLLTAHLWELATTYFDYYYLSENCSYHVLTLLEAANPELNLVEKLPAVVIPADTIRILNREPGLVGRIRYRPSIRVLFEERLKNLSSDQKDELEKITSQFGSVPTTKDVHVLDAAIDYIDYTHHKDLVNSDSPASLWKQKFLSYRSTFHDDTPEPKTKVPEKEYPHLGHESARIGLDYGHSERFGPSLGLQFRFALHDLLDARAGYPPYAQIEFFTTKLRYNFELDRPNSSNGYGKPKHVWLEDFGLIRVVSLSDFTRFSKRLSWKVNVGAKTLRDENCDQCLAGTSGVGFGLTFKPIEKLPVQFISMLEAGFDVAPSLHPFWARVGAGPSAAIRISWNDQMTTMLHGLYMPKLPSHHDTFEYGLETRLALSRNLAINGKWIRYSDEKSFPWQYQLGAMFYY